MADKRGRLAGRLASRFRKPDDATPEETPSAAPPEGRPPLPEEPLVSVVVPVYAVEQYIDDCLTSILGQTYRNLEVVVVDDGSPDWSMHVVDQHAARDQRITIVHQDNAGLGAARNRGIDEATGDLVTFVDSDDTIPENAIANHVRQLVRTGSDFSVGALERQQSETSYVQKPWSRRLHEVLRREVTLEDVPEAMANVFACTKVFRADFLAEIGLRFPVGVRYEDQVPITRAYLKARSFDLLPDVVYSWRSRRDGSSITQQKARKDDLHDRLLAVDEVRRMVVERDSPAVLRGWYGKVFEFDLFAYIRAAVDADDDYYATLVETVRHVLDSAPPDAWDAVDLRHRIAAWALVHEGREALIRLLESPLLTGNVPVRTHGDHPEADPDRLGLHGDVPAELLAVSERDLLVEARLDSLAVDGGALVVRGVGFTRYVDSSLPHEVALTFQRRAGGDPVTVATRGEHVEDVNVFADRHHEDHRDDGFVAKVPLEDLVAASDGARTVWHTRVACTTLGRTRNAVFRDRVDHGSALRPARSLADDVLVEATWSDRLGLVVTVRRDWVALVGRDGATLTLRAAPGVTPSSLRLQQDEVATVEPDGTGSFRATLDLSGVADADRRLLVATGSGKPQPLVDLDATDDGFVRAVGQLGRLETHDVSFDAGAVRLSGTLVGSAPASLRLVGPRATTSGTVTVDGDRWRAELPTVRPSLLDGAPLPLPRDAYRVLSDDGHAVVGLPELDPADAPRDAVREWAPRLLDGGALAVERSRGAELEAQTRHGQQELLTGAYAGGLRGERRPLVLVDAFVGRGLFHAAGAVVASLRAERPDLDVVWALRDESLPPPPGVTPVSRGSATWFEQLAAASHVLTNGTMPRFYEKPAGQRLVQLWSGTPLLRFGYAVPAGEAGHGPEQRAFARDAAGWDVLCTGSPDATAWMREATRYDGEVREVGHPALDAYRADDRAARAAAGRHRLGIGDGPVLLYAPTTRQAVRAHTRRDKVVDLDVEALHKAVPGLTVLHRGHPNTANRAVLGPESGMLDVTLYPELSDLVLLSDAVVSDYSSLVVDVLASDTPLALFVPDKEDFDEVGWFVDLFEDPPGPVATTTEELLPWLTDGLGTSYPGRQRLAEQLLPLDDGHAADRAVAAEWGRD
ncbi:bifunctional glycosyltransferase/CDP-glycerol:glycerophosphate glycerophosphotransferase [Nocardioides iriomotensis]|uniref:Glycosyltransferase family 2 protein n=1 Tax=Nocardioides iriomotensis TaxID=715784 RepID=A0A4Q5J775_9ACTN|nr:CDP-glycerol glycerophosphotransferase family protein [Nocardioides iriomotensis]RYU14517.1 glycosyltransferase family 2 protein [Nocardioides iriomotensis]